MTFEEAWERLGLVSSNPIVPKGKRVRQGIVLKDAHQEFNIGKPGTALDQANDFITILKKESQRSLVMQQLLITIAENCSKQPVVLYFANYSAACFDSAPNWAVDLLDHSILCWDPQEVPDSGHWVGHTKGEMIIHILEERMYMTKPGKDFTSSHLKCFLKDSYQNRYRREMGFTFDVISYDLHQTAHNHTENELSRWEGVDAGGYALLIHNVHTGKMIMDPLLCNYVPSKSQLEFTKFDVQDFITQRITNYLGYCKKDFEHNHTIEQENIIGIKFWIHQKYDTKEEVDTVILNLLGPYMIGIVRKKTWNVLRISIRNKMIPTEKLIEVGKKTFEQNFKEPIPDGWKELQYPNQNEITGIKEKMLYLMTFTHHLSEDEAMQVIQVLQEHF